MPEVAWHRLQELNGIGSSMAAALSHSGFHFAEDLLRRPPMAIARDIENISGVTLANAFTIYIPQARLLRLSGLDSAQSAALVQAGFTYGRLCFVDVSAIAKVVPSLSTEDLAQIRLEAAQRLMSSTVMVRVVDQTGIAVPGANVFVVDPPGYGDQIAWRFPTNEFGETLVEFLSPEFHRFTAMSEDRWGESTLNLNLREYCTLILPLNKDAPDGVTFDEESQGPSMRVGSVIRVERELADWPEGSLLQVVSIAEDVVHLSGFYRQKVGGHWRTTFTIAPSSELDPSIGVGAVVRREQGTLVEAAADAQAMRYELVRQFALSQLSARLGEVGNA